MEFKEVPLPHVGRDGPWAMPLGLIKWSLHAAHRAYRLGVPPWASWNTAPCSLSPCCWLLPVLCRFVLLRCEVFWEQAQTICSSCIPRPPPPPPSYFKMKLWWPIPDGSWEKVNLRKRRGTELHFLCLNFQTFPRWYKKPPQSVWKCEFPGWPERSVWGKGN